MKKLLKQGKRLGLAAIPVALIAVLLMGSVVPARAEPEKVVKIGIIVPFTGALATLGVPNGQGAIDYIRYVDEQGGINGIKVEAPWEDYRSAPGRALMAYNRMREKGIVVGITTEEAALYSFLPRLIRDEMPFIYAAGAASFIAQHRPQWVVGSGPLYENAVAFGAKWILEMWTEERPPRLGVLSADVPVVRASYATVGPYLEEIGIEWLGVEFSPIIGCVDFSIELLRLVEKGADWVWLSHYGANGVVVIKDVERLGLMEKMSFMGESASLDQGTLRAAGKSANGWYGVYNRPTGLMCEDDPKMKVLLEVAEDYRGYKPEDVTTFYVGGWAAARIAVEALRLAIEEVGVENLTGRSVRDSFYRIKDFDLGFGLPVTIAEEDSTFCAGFYRALIKGDTIAPVRGWERVPRVFHYIMIDSEEARAGRC